MRGEKKMKNRNFSYIALAVLLMSLGMLSIAGGCATGVSEADYNALKTELQTTKAELEILKAQTPNSAAGSADLAKVGAYAEISDRSLDAWRLLYGEPSKYGYAKGETARWISDLDAKITAVNDAGLTFLWKSYVAATPGADQLKKGVAILTYLSDKIKTLTAK
jgi:hypothetical protein